MIQKSYKVKRWEMGIEKGEMVTCKYAYYIASN